MARINDRTLVQAVGDDQIVIVDDHTGNEQVLTVYEALALMQMLGYLITCLNYERSQR